MESEDSHETVRQKFISVLEPVIESGDVNNITTLLSSLSNICRPDAGIIVPVNQGSEEVNTIEFTCWLISQLLTISSSAQVHQDVTNLLTNIFHLIASKNSKILPDFIKEFIAIGKEATTVLFDGGTVIRECFAALLHDNESTLKPKKLILKNDETTDHTLCKIVQVIGCTSSHINLLGMDYIDELWLLIGQSLEAGNLLLKATALKATGLLLVSCQLPLNFERQDYILQLVASCVIAIMRGDFQNDAKDETDICTTTLQCFEANLCLVFSNLQIQLNNVYKGLSYDIMESVRQFLGYKHRLSKITGSLLQVLLQFSCKVLEIHDGHIQAKAALMALEEAVIHNLHLKEVIEVCLKRFILRELKAVFPVNKSSSSIITRKRTLSESEIEIGIVTASTVSIWWSKIEDKIHSIIKTLSIVNRDDELIQNIGLLINYMKLISDMNATLSHWEVCVVQYFPEHMLSSLTEAVVANLSRTDSIGSVLNTFLLLRHIVFVNSLSSASYSVTGRIANLHHTWVALASLPWLANEVQWLDLKVSDISVIISISAKASWTNELQVKIASFPIIALSLKNVAPQWKCHVLRYVLSEGNPDLLNSIAEWLPMLLHHLPHTSSHSLFGESFEMFFSSQNPTTLRIFCKSLRYLLCAIQHHTVIMPEEGFPCAPSSLSCNVCGAKSSQFFESDRSKLNSDQGLALQILNLAKSSDSHVVLGFIDALPAYLHHCSISTAAFVQLMDILLLKDVSVVEAFCDKISLFLGSQCIDQNQKTDKMEYHLLSFLQKIMELPSKIGDKQCCENQVPVMLVLESLIRARVLALNDHTLHLVMKCLVSSDREISARAHLLVLDWARNLSITPKELYVKNKQTASKLLSQFLKEGDVAPLLTHFAVVFCWTPSSDDKHRDLSYNSCAVFANTQLPYLLPPLVVRSGNEGTPSLLQELAAFLQTRLRDMIIDHFQHILAYLVCNCEAREKEKILQFISATTDIQIHKIRKCSVQNQVNELIMDLHDHRQLVLKEFVAMQAIEKDMTVKANNEDIAKRVAQFLSPRLLGILGFLDGKLVSTSTVYSEKESALLSLSELLLLMGKEHVSPIARKVLASLKMALRIDNSKFTQINCKAWTSYLQSVDESTLEGIIEEVLILITPLLRERPEEMAPVLKKIILETESIKPLLRNFPLMPDHPSMNEINNHIREAQQQLQGESLEHVLEVLQQISKGLVHDSVDVRRHYLKSLKYILSLKQMDVYHLILDSDRVHFVVSKIYDALLGMCRESEELHVLVAECFGLFGAIDPARLIPVKDEETSFEVFTDIETKNFVLNLVLVISRAVMSATDTHTQTCALYAMQEILRIYKIGASTSRNDNSVGASVYSSLPVNIQEILLPLHSSKYTVSTSGNRMSTTSLPCPVYGTKYSQTFNQWLSSWVCSLIDLLIGERSKQVFLACKPIMRRISTTAIELLSPLLVCVLTESSDSHISVVTEILSVISDDRIYLAESKEPDSSCNNRSRSIQRPSGKLQHLAVQTIFKCLDYVSRWADNQKKYLHTLHKSRSTAIFNKVEVKRVLDFLGKIPSDSIAKISFKFQAYSRSLRNLELYLKENPDRLKSNLSFLQSIYIALDEPDGVVGVAAIRQEEPTLHEQIIEHEAAGRLHDALGCYERLCSGHGHEDSYKGMLKCYLSLDQPQSVLNITQGLICREPQLAVSVNEYRVEAAWRLGQWEQLEAFLKTDNPPSWGVGIGKVLLAARDRNESAYVAAMRDLRIQQITPLSAASMEMGAFQRAYPHILRLQILNELEEMMSLLLKIPLVKNEDRNEFVIYGQEKSNNQQTLDEINVRWDQRFALVQTSHRYLEPLLSFRRTLLKIGQDWSKDTNPTLSQSLLVQLECIWLLSAKVSRKAGLLQHGEWAFLGAGYGRDVFMERAKWYWMKGEHHQAVATLKRGIDKFFTDLELLKSDSANEVDKLSCSEAKLLLAKYSEDSATLDVNTIKKFYREVCDVNRSWEDGHFNLAMYYDRLLSTLDVKDKPAEWLYHIVQSFGKSLYHGCKHLYQSMPRLLSIWFDFGARVAEIEGQQKLNAVILQKLREMNEVLVTLLDRLPSYMFLTALPQLISRICHSREDVFEVLKCILAAMLSIYPQQAIWHMVQVSKSSYEMRQVRCFKVFEAAKKKNLGLIKFTNDATKLVDLLIELSNKPVDKAATILNINNILRALPKLLSDSKFSNIILPLQSQMTVTLPSGYGSVSLKDLCNHDPFPRSNIYLMGIEDNVEIMTSLVRPKKITLRGSDGHSYIMMCKPKDDMRKDCRLMEFNTFVNRLLLRDPESRRRSLKIRTYIVVPLNEECGLIEWVPNLYGLRPLIHKLYRETGQYLPGQELKKYLVDKKAPLDLKRKVFVEELLPKHPPIFGKWFHDTFFDPQSWLRARLAYCRTTAVMSMVGYILGLGDRHGENILFDSSSGDTVHVDFNCLFNKGETFDYPEKVPFRLTHNMIDAMGPTGYEGIFRKTSEVTMRVMRMEREELMSVLKPFIHDPLVEWEKEDRTGRKPGRADANTKAVGEINNLKAQKHVRDIEDRLNGQIHKGRGVQLPLSVEGQVNVLIDEATSLDNLCQMYLGWAPYL